MATTYDDASGSETDEAELCSKRWSASLDDALEQLSLRPDWPPSPPARLSFLGLPAEVRLRIYDYLPAPSVPARVFQDELAIPNPFAILHVSRQINSEAKPILYSNIAVDSSWLKHVPTHAADYIGTVAITARYGYSGLETWSCEPALRLFNPSGKGWSLENMWRYLGRAFPSVRFVRLRSALLPPRRRARVEILGGEEDDERGVEKGPVNVLLALRCVVVESPSGGSVLLGERPAWASELFESLRAEVVRLSGSAVVVDESERW